MFNSLRNNGKGIILMLLASVLVAFGQLCWKLWAGSDLAWLLLGCSLYGIGAGLMVYALRFGKLSVLHPVLSAGYVFALVFGCFFLNEPISTQKVIGVALIMAGIFCIGIGDH